MESKWTMEVVLETVKLRTTNSVYDNDEVLLSILRSFFLLSLGSYAGMVSISLYWYVCFPKRELANMYVTGLVAKAVFWFFKKS
jgi:hypothetical protein